MTTDIATVFTASGDVEAAEIQGFLEASGITTFLRGEALRKTHGFTIGGLGSVEILVAAPDAERARALLASADRGEFRLGDDAAIDE